MRGLLWVLVVLLASHVGYSGTWPPPARIRFDEVSDSAGIAHTGITYGVAWGDYDGDGYPDIYVSNHGVGPSYLWHNEGDGTFSSANSLLDPTGALVDIHASQWVDYDNDGDQDLFVVTGAALGLSTAENLFYVNNGDGTFTEDGASVGLQYQYGRGRGSVWYDWTGDGYLDVVILNAHQGDGTEPSATFEYSGGSYSATVPNRLPDVIKLDTTNTWFRGQWSDLGNDGDVELILSAAAPKVVIVEPTGATWSDVTAAEGMGVVQLSYDMYAMDMTKDQIPDWLGLSVTGVYDYYEKMDDYTVGLLTFSSGGQDDMDVVTTGDMTMEWGTWGGMFQNAVYIGSTGYHPVTNPFTIEPDEPLSQGLSACGGGSDCALVGYNVASGEWEVRVDLSDRHESLYTFSEKAIYISSSFTADQTREKADFFLQGGTTLSDVSKLFGLGVERGCLWMGVGDFDNDMDLDVYLGCTGDVSNKPNILLENQYGLFRVVPGAGGAEGTESGRVEAVAVADYNRDGFLDILVANGMGWAPLGRGAIQLFRNRGNGNHWLEIDLVGTSSNRDGIGARVEVTAGGVVQMREQYGGSHAQAQDHTRIHFGLGQNASASQVEIDWPAGGTQQLGVTAADQILVVTEP